MTTIGYDELNPGVQGNSCYMNIWGVRHLFRYQNVYVWNSVTKWSVDNMIVDDMIIRYVAGGRATNKDPVFHKRPVAYFA